MPHRTFAVFCYSLTSMDQSTEQTIEPTAEHSESQKEKSRAGLYAAIITGACVVGASIIVASMIASGGKGPSGKAAATATANSLEEKVSPTKGVELPVTWGDLGRKMTGAGVIDQAKFAALYAERGGMASDIKAMLQNSGNGRILITRENSGSVLNLLWALGLGNKNDILAKGEMSDPRYGGPGVFASTGGWTLAEGDPMRHYNMHELMKLDPEAQAKVERVTKNIYRPCCGNSTHFPDCNHGMAMLGLMELMASQGASEADMYRAALTVNSYWFPEQYATIAAWFASQKVAWNNVDPQKALGADYSSGAGFQQVSEAVSRLFQPEESQESQDPHGHPSSGGCSV